MNDLASIVVTSYNHAEYLAQRMDSILAQTYENMEIVVVDDCSTDNSLEILNKYASHPKVKIFPLQKNGGYANACNFGVSQCRGEFVMFAECDDFNSPEHVAALMQALNSHPSAVAAYCRSHIVDSCGNTLRDDYQCREPSFRNICANSALIPAKIMQRFLLRSCVIPNMSAAMFRRTEFLKIGGLSTKFTACADWDFWCRLAERGDVYYVATPLNFFRTHPESVRSTFSMQRQVCEMMELLDASANRLSLTFTERISFNVALGDIWAGQFSANPTAWVKSFWPILKKSTSYSIFSILYLCISVCKILRRKIA
ncbi:Glycosyl transferase family 2 [Formivibrio citricus]|uniref:Glycosyl transferase family 2 n=1 Tax=Formivibrio citricus TaxID=83765 RepID=A0A1I4XWU6_9NEIS|nr:glycosyltransferase [Formivibrio citricus]SFN30255.1 Glycosyl transferase family 2 [Formivibrio citricus]